MTAKFELYTDKAGEARFRLKAANGENILAASEGYSSKAAAVKGIESIKKNSIDDARYARREGQSGKPHFVLKAGNGEVIGTSQNYSSASAMENGIDSVKRCAPQAVIEDHR